MVISKKLVPLFVLCIVSASLGIPTEHVNEGRGIGSTIWGWITYPFTWWSSGSTANNEIPVESSTSSSTDNTIEVAKHNITVWCNDQTCTTMKCDQLGCYNVTCNIYDTDLTGLCREYNSSVTSTSPPQVTEDNKTTETPTTPAVLPSTPNTNVDIEKPPLELEAVLSSTIPEGEETVDDSN